MAERPNILFIYSDQHRFDCVGCNGHPLLRTPNLDRLAREGVNFTHAFTPIPMCVPARCSLLTGQWASRHGTIFNYDGETFAPLPQGIATVPAAITAAHYHTVHIGRWHVDQRRSPTDFGFHDYLPEWRYGQWRKGQGLPANPKEDGWRGGPDAGITPEQSRLAWGADQVMRWLDFCSGESDPFCIHWNTVEPHLPCHPPEPYASMYDPADIAPWPGFDDDLATKPAMQKSLNLLRDTEGMSWSEWAQVAAYYFGTITHFDAQIGRVLAWLDERGLADDTLVIYSSDHGDMGGSHRMVDKHCVMYDDVLRVPLIMRWPKGLPAGRTCDAFVANAVDIARTTCTVAGGTPPPDCAGQDLIAVARGEAQGYPDIFASYHGNQYGVYSQRVVRERRWKYVWNVTDMDELYDLESDPGELVNRIHDPVAQRELPRLRRRLCEWLEATGDRLRAPRKQLMRNESVWDAGPWPRQDVAARS